jgi:coenzyme PQQ precursor peptide PqqA
MIGCCDWSVHQSDIPNDATFTRGETTMWTKPEFTEMRFGFEVTMYIYNR